MDYSSTLLLRVEKKRSSHSSRQSFLEQKPGDTSHLEVSPDSVNAFSRNAEKDPLRLSLQKECQKGPAMRFLASDVERLASWPPGTAAPPRLSSLGSTGLRAGYRLAARKIGLTGHHLLVRHRPILTTHPNGSGFTPVCIPVMSSNSVWATFPVLPSAT